MTRLLIVALAVTTLAPGADAGSGGDDGVTTTASGRSSMAFSDSANPMAGVPGQSCAIALPTTAGTGFERTVTVKAHLAVVAATIAEGGFKAVGSRSTTVTFTYARASDPDDDPTAATHTINVSYPTRQHRTFPQATMWA